MWFFVPHASVVYVLLRDRERFPARPRRMYAVFDLGAVFYWAIPTAPPWWAARHGRLEDGQAVHVRRMMIEYGEQFWGDRWGDLYDVLGGNPLAAMPSLHFATSLMAAHVLSEVGPVAGAWGGPMRRLLGLALVYLGEHYAVDLIAGAALAETVRARHPDCAAGRRLSPCVQAARGRACRRERARCPRRVPPRERAGAGRCPTAGRCWREPSTREEMPRVVFTRRRLLISVLFVVSTVAFLYFVLPKLLGLQETWNRIQHGNGWWLALAAVLEVCSFVGYIVLFRAVFVRGEIADRLARELPDHDGRAGRDAAVRGGRRGRHRADRVGAAPLGDGAADRRLPDDRVPGAALRRLHG